MPIAVRCPHCETAHNLPDRAAGRSFRCKQCGEPMSAPAAMAERIGRGAVPPSRRPPPARRSRFGVGAFLLLVFGSFFGLAILAALLLPAIQQARRAAQAAGPVGSWTTVTTDVENVTVKMPGPPGRQVVSGPEGERVPVLAWERGSRAYTFAFERYDGYADDEVALFDDAGAAETKLLLADLFGANAAMAGGRLISIDDPRKDGDYYFLAWQSEMPNPAGSSDLHVHSRTYLYPEAVITIQYITPQPDAAEAEKYFATFQAPPIEDVVDAASLEDLENPPQGDSTEELTVEQFEQQFEVSP